MGLRLSRENTDDQGDHRDDNNTSPANDQESASALLRLLRLSKLFEFDSALFSFGILRLRGHCTTLRVKAGRRGNQPREVSRAG